MQRIGEWLRRIPTWVWVFLTLTQLLRVVTLPAEIRKADAWLEKSYEFAVAFNDSDVTPDAESFASRRRWDFATALICAPLVATGAVLSWRRHRAAAAMKESRHDCPDSRS